MTSQIKKRLSALEELHGEPEEPIPDGLGHFYDAIEEFKRTGIRTKAIDVWDFFYGGVPALAEGMQ
jgi:hypothetical protein